MPAALDSRNLSLLVTSQMRREISSRSGSTSASKVITSIRISPRHLSSIRESSMILRMPRVPGKFLRPMFAPGSLATYGCLHARENGRWSAWPEHLSSPRRSVGYVAVPSQTRSTSTHVRPTPTLPSNLVTSLHVSCAAHTTKDVKVAVDLRATIPKTTPAAPSPGGRRLPSKAYLRSKTGTYYFRTIKPIPYNEAYERMLSRNHAVGLSQAEGLARTVAGG